MPPGAERHGLASHELASQDHLSVAFHVHIPNVFTLTVNVARSEKKAVRPVRAEARVKCKVVWPLKLSGTDVRRWPRKLHRAGILNSVMLYPSLDLFRPGPSCINHDAFAEQAEARMVRPGGAPPGQAEVAVHGA